MQNLYDVYQEKLQAKGKNVLTSLFLKQKTIPQETILEKALRYYNRTWETQYYMIWGKVFASNGVFVNIVCQSLEDLKSVRVGNDLIVLNFGDPESVYLSPNGWEIW